MDNTFNEQVLQALTDLIRLTENLKLPVKDRRNVENAKMIRAKCRSFVNKEPVKPIDRVTIDLLESSLRICDINMMRSTIDKVIDLVELIEDKGDEVTLKDIIEVKNNHKQLAC